MAHPLFVKCDAHAPAPVVVNRVRWVGPDAFSTAHLTLRPDQVDVVVFARNQSAPFAAALAAFAYNASIQFKPADDVDEHAVAGKGVLFINTAPHPGWRLRDYAVLSHSQQAIAPEKFLHVPRTSVCVLAWTYFFPGTRLPALYEAIQARDFNVPLDDRAAIMAGLDACAGWCATCWASYTFNDALEYLIDIGEALERRRLHSARGYAKHARLRALVLREPVVGWQNRVWAVNCTDERCAADAAAYLLHQDGCGADVAALFWYDLDSRMFRFTLTSLPGRGPDLLTVLPRIYHTRLRCTQTNRIEFDARMEDVLEDVDVY